MSENERMIEIEEEIRKTDPVLADHMRRSREGTERIQKQLDKILASLPERPEERRTQ